MIETYWVLFIKVALILAFLNDNEIWVQIEQQIEYFQIVNFFKSIFSEELLFEKFSLCGNLASVFAFSSWFDQECY